MGTLTGIEVKHNSRYGADCVPCLGPPEIAAEIAALHQNEGPHLAAGLRARTSADRSGARGKNDVPGRERPSGETTTWIPKGPGSGSWSAPIPRTAIVCEAAAAVKVRAKSRRDLDSRRLLAKKHFTGKGEWELLNCRFRILIGLPLVAQRRWRFDRKKANTLLTKTDLLIEDAEMRRKTRRRRNQIIFKCLSPRVPP